MEDQAEECEQEILALRSIYEDEEQLVFGQTSQDVPQGKFLASPTLLTSFHICVQKNTASDMEPAEGKGKKSVQVSYLPPIQLDFVLPSGYPASHPPFYTISCPWMTRQQLTKLCRRLDEIWRENHGCVILYNWFQFLEYDSLEYLQVMSPLVLYEEDTPPENIGSLTGKESTETDSSSNPGNGGQEDLSTPSIDFDGCREADTDGEPYSYVYICYCADPDRECSMSKDGLDCRTVQRRSASATRLMNFLLEFNRRKKQEVFERSMVLCSVCDRKLGGRMCMLFEACHHSFCRECLQEYFTLQIKDGSVKSLHCPEPKCKSQAHPNQVKELVSKELYTRYEKLLLQVSLDSMTDIVYCPRRQCQYPVVKENDLGQCPRCLYAFCVYCTHAYHGSSLCQIRSEEVRKIHEKYIKGSAETKTFLEKRYGKKAIMQALEESDTLAWCEENAKICPGCHTRIEKTEGCNMVTCSKCMAKFCWICGTLIVTENPYDHFTQKANKCYAKLFLGVDPNYEEYFDFEEDEDDDGQYHEYDDLL